MYDATLVSETPALRAAFSSRSGSRSRPRQGPNVTAWTWIGRPPVRVRTVIWMVAPPCPFHVQ